MPTIEDKENFPFTREQLIHLRKEIDKAGSFEKFLQQKHAIHYEGDKVLLCQLEDVEGYKQRFLTGTFEPLRFYYDTEPYPFLFWKAFFEALEKYESKESEEVA